MDKHTASERRFSLNMTHLPHPIAESTTLNLNGTIASSSNAAHFPWGGTSISPKQRSNSSICLTDMQQTSRSNVSSLQRSRMNTSKIDPRIYADVQSKGLVSRIVQYHENGKQLQRSMSTSNLYSKPGKFPVVNLQKTELPYRATQKNVSMTRIAPPEKSIFYGNTLSSLLRSNSVICLQKSDEELSHENRPILHPPATEGEMAPTRSVLDVLKEISRKRINNDDTDLANDTIKKYCNRDYTDHIYDGAAKVVDMRNIASPSAQLITSTTPLNNKRQREAMSTAQSSLSQYSHPTSSLPLGRVTHATQTQQQQQQPQTQHSPEQIAKKRLCNYNNDITSSLSSSMIHAHKRKFYEQRRNALQRSPPTATEEYETHKAKIQRQQPDLHLQQLSKTLNYTTPITPIPPTPLNQNVDGLRSAPTIQPALTKAPSLPVMAEPQRTTSEPMNMGSKVRSIEVSTTATTSYKPKLTLFNKKYDDAETQATESNSELEDGAVVDVDVCADIQFVKPKKSSSLTGSKNPVIERTQKSKLALMLSGLRGELYQGDDEIDVAAKKPVTTDVSSTPTTTITTTTTSTSTAGNFTMRATVTTTANIANSATVTTTTSVLPAATPAIKTTTSITFDTSATKVTPITTPAFAPPVQTTTTSSSPAANNATTTTTTVPILGGFKFTPAATSITTTSTATPTTKTASPLVGIKLNPTPVTNFNPPVAAFNTTANKSVSNSIATGMGPVPQLQGFAFGSLTKNTAADTAPTQTSTTTQANTITAPTISAATATTQAGGFKFGLTTPANSTAGAAPAFGTFGNPQTANANATMGTSAMNTSPPAFSFSAPTTTTTVTSNFNVPKPAFSFGGTTTAASTLGGTSSAPKFSIGPATSSSAPAFNVNNMTVTTSTPSSFGTVTTASNVFGNTFTAPTTAPTFNFGAPQTTSAAQTSNGTATSTTNATGMFSFGGNKTTQKPTAPATPFSFGSGTKSVAPTTTATAQPATGAFSFGTGQATTTATNNSATTGSNVFGFGGGAAQPTTSTTNNLFANASINTTNNTSNATIKPTTFAFAANSTNTGSQQQQQQPQQQQQQVAPTFGNNTTAFSFGGASGIAAAKSDKPATGGFSFGAATANTTSTVPFGNTSVTNTNQSANTGIVKPSFSFGGSTNSTGATDASKSLFGGVTNNNTGTNTNNTFGALAAANNNASMNNTFGALANQNKNFTFGGASSNTTPAATTNIFGGAATSTNTAAASTTGGFSFGSSNSNNNNAAANASNINKPAAAAFSFSGSNNSNSNNAPFSFGGGMTGATKPADNSTASNKSFSFGSNAAATNTASIFGGANKTESTNTATPFSFSAGSTAPVAGAPTTNGNMFAPPPNITAGPGDRPIRRATRRLQKS